MKVKITHDTIADGKPVQKGQTIEISDAEAELMIAQKKAKNAGDEEVETESDDSIDEVPEPTPHVEGKKKGK